MRVDIKIRRPRVIKILSISKKPVYPARTSTRTCVLKPESLALAAAPAALTFSSNKVLAGTGKHFQYCPDLFLSTNSPVTLTRKYLNMLILKRVVFRIFKDSVFKKESASYTALKSTKCALSAVHRFSDKSLQTNIPFSTPKGALQGNSYLIGSSLYHTDTIPQCV